MKTYLYETLVGSHLYGLAHAGSDIDTMRIYTGTMGQSNRKGLQTITGDLDVLEFPLGAFVMMASRGAPQILEAMYSPIAAPSAIDGLRWGFRADTAAAVNSYRNRIARNFKKASSQPDPVKFYRHSLRRAWNLRDLLQNGIFNPMMSDKARELAGNMLADCHSKEQFAELIRSQCPCPVDLR